MDFIDEQDVAVLEVGEKSGEIARLGDHWTGRRSEIHAELARHDLRQRRLAEPRRAGEEDMVERLAPRAGRVNEHLEIATDFRLTDELRQGLRAQGNLGLVFVPFHGSEHPLSHLLRELL